MLLLKERTSTESHQIRNFQCSSALSRFDLSHQSIQKIVRVNHCWPCVIPIQCPFSYLLIRFSWYACVELITTCSYILYIKDSMLVCVWLFELYANHYSTCNGKRTAIRWTLKWRCWKDKYNFRFSAGLRMKKGVHPCLQQEADSGDTHIKVTGSNIEPPGQV